VASTVEGIPFAVVAGNPSAEVAFPLVAAGGTPSAEEASTEEASTAEDIPFAEVASAAEGIPSVAEAEHNRVASFLTCLKTDSLAG